MKTKNGGFTLFELIISMALLTILSALSYKSYTTYTDRQYVAKAQQEVIRLAIELEKFKSNNFTYAGFSTPSATVPRGATSDKVKYNITVVDTNSGSSLTSTTATGSQWAIKAVGTKSNSPAFLMNSDGVQCRNASANRVTYKTCGTSLQGSENW